MQSTRRSDRGHAAGEGAGETLHHPAYDETRGAGPDGAAPRKAGAATLSLTGRALRYLSSREHSRAELERKLAPFEDAPGAVAKVLDALQAKGFVSDARVIESVLYRRAAKLGAARIRQELQAKGLEPQAIAQAVGELRTTELQRAREVWSKKFGTPPASAAERGKQMRFLSARGFTGDVIARVVQGADGE